MNRRGGRPPRSGQPPISDDKPFLQAPPDPARAAKPAKPALPPQPGFTFSKHEPEEGQLSIGIIVGAFGLRGDVKVQLDTDFPERLVPGRNVYVGGAPHRIRRVRASSTSATLGLSGVTNRTAAEQLRGQIITVDEAGLPPLEEGQYYYHQILGLRVETPAGELLGEVRDILATGANDVYIVTSAKGELMVPAVEDVVLKLAPEEGLMVVQLLPGMEPQPASVKRETKKRRPPKPAPPPETENAP